MALTVASFGAVSVLDAGTASAERVELPVNQLAPEIIAASSEAVVALDDYAATGSVAAERTLAYHRAIAARYVAQQLGYDEFEMVAAWSLAPLGHQRAVLGAMTQIGVPYRTNTSIEGEGFDCSGLTSYAWQGAGVELFRNSTAQINDAQPVTRETARAGDLVQYPGHVMMYLGVGDAIVHSVQTGRTVELDTIAEGRRNSVRWGDPTA